MLGSAEKIEISKDETTIINGSGDGYLINERVAELKTQLSTASEFEAPTLKQRIAKLGRGIAIMYVGATSEIERLEKKDRVDDALAATKAAIEEGVVPGGGVALLRCISSLENIAGQDEDENTGIAIDRKALEAPLRQIVANAGLEGAAILPNILNGIGAYGFNARTEVYEDLWEAGVIDPTKVTRTAIENATSIASMILITECVISEDVSYRNMTADSSGIM